MTNAQESKLTDEEKAKAIEQHFEDTFGPQVDLDPELQRCLYEDENMSGIKHPLVFSLFHNPRLNHMVNEQLRQKREALDRAVEDEAWSTYCFLHERPYRLDAFLNIKDKIEDDAAYWDVLGSIWTDSENIWQSEDEWLECLSSERPQRDQMMEDWERDRLAALPETVEIFRGYQFANRQDGMSWSIDRNQAAWFATRLWVPERGGDGPMLAIATVKRDKILAFFDGRNEHEVVVLPGDADISETEEQEVH